MRNYFKSNYPRLWNTARTTNKVLQLLRRVYGYEPRDCAICGYHGKFLAEIHFPDIFVFDAICPKCQSNSRNRLLKIAIEKYELIRPGDRTLHFAPEETVSAFVRTLVADYGTADISGKGVDFAFDIEQIAQPDGSWDVIICSHVLEHVDHVRALKELHRILTPGGKLLALFPIVEAWATDYEAPEVQSARDRGLHFGKENHLRRFGASVRKEFSEAGFDLNCFAPIGPEVVKFGLIPGETLFIASRR